MNLRILLPLLCGIICSCSNSSDPYYQVDDMITYQETETPDTLKGEFVLYDSLNNVSGIESVDSFIVIMRNADKGLFSVMNSNSDSLLAQFGEIGHASNEILTPTDICQFTHDANGNIIMCVQDFERRSIIQFNLNKAITQNRIESCSRTKYDVEDYNVPLYRCFSLGGNGYLVHQSLSNEGDARDPFSIAPKVKIKQGGNEVNISFYPLLISEDSQYMLHTYTLMPRIKPDMTKFVEAHGLLNLFTIIDLQTHKTIGVRGKNSYGFDHMRKVGEESDEQKKYSKLIIYNTYCNVSDKYIFLSQDGKTTMDKLEDVINYKPRVSVFDWDGNLVYSFATREPLMRIAYNEATKHIYGLASNYNIYKYDLSEHLK